MTSGARLAALVVLIALLVLLVVLVLTTTPWKVLPEVAGGAVAPDAGRDFTAAEIARSDAYRSAIRPPAYLGLASACSPPSCSASPRPAPGGGVGRSAVRRGWWASVLVGGIAVLLVTAVVSRRSWRVGGDGAPRLRAVDQVMGGWFVRRRPWLRAAGGAGAGRPRGGLRARALAAELVVGVGRGARRRLVVLLSFVFPVLVEPVFNKFTPMPDGALRTR